MTVQILRILAIIYQSLQSYLTASQILVPAITHLFHLSFLCELINLVLKICILMLDSNNQFRITPMFFYHP